MTGEIEKSYVVDGMTCGNCERHVVEEVEQVPGVAGVDVDLATGRVTVRGTDVDDASIRAAVDEAGYVVRS
ncbi:MAG: hypothetical protein JWO69_1098 [Thermoleophilia bacterium]|jgi:copper chaperone|nr:hypothetical protein [Thermoleophilia bacterium]